MHICFEVGVYTPLGGAYLSSAGPHTKGIANLPVVPQQNGGTIDTHICTPCDRLLKRTFSGVLFDQLIGPACNAAGHGQDIFIAMHGQDAITKIRAQSDRAIEYYLGLSI